MKIVDKAALKRLAIGIPLAAVLIPLILWTVMIRMPGQSFRDELPPWTEVEERLAAQIRSDVEELAITIGERNIPNIDAYHAAADFIEERFEEIGYEVRRMPFEARGVTCHNLEVVLPGTDRPDEILVIGAHYDSVPNSPAANDNASGVAGLLALAELFFNRPAERTVRFVAFANEENPYFGTDAMGSYRYARAATERGENIIGMISLETIGYFSTEPGSQQYPFPFNLLYPDTGDFIGFIGNVRSGPFLRKAIRGFREAVDFPSEGAAVPERVPGVGWSDHWAFWQAGYPAFMVTDTAPYRYPYYHTALDLPEHLDFHRIARIVKGLEASIAGLAGRREGSR